MTPSQPLTLLWQILQTSGVTAVILIVVAWLARDYLRELLVGSVKRSYDEDLERLRSELQRATHEALERVKHTNEQQLRAEAAIIASAAAGQTAALGHRLESIQGLWSEVVELRRATPTAVRMTEMLTHHELITELEKPTSVTMREEVRLDAVAHLLTRNVERLRLGSGEELWSLFVLYRTFIGRIAAILDMELEGKRDGKGSWKSDQWLRQLAATVLDADQFKKFQQYEIGGLNLTLDAIETKFIAGARQLMSGELTAGEMTATANRIRDAMANAPRTSTVRE